MTPTGKLTLKTPMPMKKAKDSRESLGSAASLSKGADYLRESFKPAPKMDIDRKGSGY